MNIVDSVEKRNMKKKIPQFKIGDMVDVHIKIKEGEKERVQIFNGLVIAKKGGGIRTSFTVRRIVQGEGVERIFPVHSPLLIKIEVKKSHKVRRAKLYYLRDRSGKQARLKEIFTAKKKTTGKKIKAKQAEKETTKTEAKTEAKTETKVADKAADKE